MARERGSRAGEPRWRGPKPREDSEWDGNSDDSDSAKEDSLDDGPGPVLSNQASATGQSVAQSEEDRRMHKFRANPHKLRSVVSKPPNRTQESDKEIIVRPPQNLNAATTNAAAATTTQPGTASSTNSNNLSVASTHTASQASTGYTASQPSTGHTASQPGTAHTASQPSTAHTTSSNNVPVAAAPTTNPGTASSTTSNNLPVANIPTAITPGITSSTTAGNVPVASTRPIAKPKASSSSTTSNNVPVARAPTVRKRKASSVSTTGNNVPAARTAPAAKPKASASLTSSSNVPAARAPTTKKPGASSSALNNRVPIIRGPTLPFPRANATVAGARPDGNRTSNALVPGPQAPAPRPASSVPAAPVPATPVPAGLAPVAPVPVAATRFFTPSGPQPTHDDSLPTVNLTSEDQSRVGLAKNQYRDDDGDVVTCPAGTCFSQDVRDWPRNMYHTAEAYIETAVASGGTGDVDDRQYLLGVQSGIGQGVAMLKRLLLREYELTGRLWNLPVQFESPEGVPATRAAVADLIASGDIVEMMAAMDAGNQSIMLHHGGRAGGDEDDEEDESDGDGDGDDEGRDESAVESDDDEDEDDVVGDNVNIATSDAALAPARPVQGPSLPEYVSPADVGGLVPGQHLPAARPDPFFGAGEYGPRE
ncbi:hypothetical protein LQW54_009523 [Pestalotiopsis sp. IQ-011]